MAELKTKQNDADVGAFLDGIENEKRRADCRAVVELMAEVTGEPPAMWGDSIIGFGSYHYKYSTGREGDWMATGVSPRKQSLTVYIMTGFQRHEALMKRLGRYTTGKSCPLHQEAGGRRRGRAAGAGPGILRAGVEGAVRLVTRSQESSP